MFSEQTLAGGGATSSKSLLSRRDFLKLGGVGVAGMAVLGLQAAAVEVKAQAKSSSIRPTLQALFIG